MLVNDGIRLNIWLNLTNKFSYSEFVTACTFAGVEPLDMMEFAQKIGIISVAIEEFPELSPAEAYIKFVQEANTPKVISNVKPPVITRAPEFVTEPSALAQEPARKCGGCGGGRVL